MRAGIRMRTSGIALHGMLTTAYRELGVRVPDITAEGVVEAVERVVCILDREPRLCHGLLLRSLTSAS